MLNLGFYFCLLLGIIFLILGIIFAFLKEKGAMLISGFNTLPEREREKYDKARMSRDQRNLFFLWCVVFLIGGALSYFVNTYCAIPAFAVWLVLFFREVYIDTEKAFGKNRK